MKRLNRPNLIIASALLIIAAVLGACASSGAPASDNNPSTPNQNAPLAAAPTVAPTQAPSPTQPPAPTQAPSPTQPPAATAAPMSANPQDALSKALAALSSAKTLRLTVNSSTAGSTETDVFEYVNPGAYHVMQSNGNEIIAIKGQGAYEKQAGKWSKLPIPANLLDQIIGTVNPIAVIDKERQKLDQKTTPAVGADILDGKPMVTYQYSNPLGHAGYVKFWYGLTDGWMYKFEGSDQTGKGDGTIEYNVPISITPPM